MFPLYFARVFFQFFFAFRFIKFQLRGFVRPPLVAFPLGIVGMTAVAAPTSVAVSLFSALLRRRTRRTNVELPQCLSHMVLKRSERASRAKNQEN